jgi:8-oxo-dGTP diphosphatase
VDISTFNLIYGQNVRIRVCGILANENGILLIKHEPLGKYGYLWSPPGGKVEFGATMEENLKREFNEEVGLDIEVGEFMFLNEYINTPIHAIEIFFKIKSYTGELKLGIDPELPLKDQIIKNTEFIPFPVIKDMNPATVHNIFSICESQEELINLRGFFKYEDN